MTIDASGEFWRGNEPDDVGEYLKAYTADNYPVARVIACRCANCGTDELHLDADPDAGCARWTCSKCQSQRFIGDSEEYWLEGDPEHAICPECKGETYNVAV